LKQALYRLSIITLIAKAGWITRSSGRNSGVMDAVEPRSKRSRMVGYTINFDMLNKQA